MILCALTLPGHYPASFGRKNPPPVIEYIPILSGDPLLEVVYLCILNETMLILAVAVVQTLNT